MTEHEVAVAREDLAGLDPRTIDPTRLVEESIRFLLQREPKESILREFSIEEIARYFPEYPAVMRRRLGI